MKRPLTLTIFMGFVLWSTLHAVGSPLRRVGVRDIYATYGYEALYYALILFSVCAGPALLYALWRAKAWGYALGFVWLGVGIAHNAGVALVVHLNKPLVAGLLVAVLEDRGRERDEFFELFLHSPLPQLYMCAAAGVLICVLAFFARAA